MATPGYAQMLQSTMALGTETSYSPQVQQSGYQQAVERARRRRMGRAGRMTGGQLLRSGNIITQGSSNQSSVNTQQAARDTLMADAPTAKSLYEFASGIKGRIRKKTKTYAAHLGLTKDMDVDSVDFYKIKQSGGTRGARGQRSADHRRKRIAGQLERSYRNYLKDFQKQLEERARKISQL